VPIEVIRGHRVKLIETDNRHDYLLDGSPIPGCTSILQRSGYSDYSGIPQATLTAKAEFGSKIHELTHFYDDNDLDMNDLIDFPAYSRRVEGWAQFREDWEFTPDPTWSEQPIAIVVNGMTFGVKPDCFGVGRFGMGGTSLLSTVEKKTTVEIERSAELQTAAQALALKSPECPIPGRIVCQLLDEKDRTGKYYRIHQCENRRDESLWLACLAIDIDKRNSKVIK
jgi:hypothetical protein